MSNSILEDPNRYIIEYCEQTKFSCMFIGIALFLIVVFFIAPFSLSSISSFIVKSIILFLLFISSYILLKAVLPVIDVKGALETDMFPDLKKNFFITVFFVFILISLGIVVIRK